MMGASVPYAVVVMQMASATHDDWPNPSLEKTSATTANPRPSDTSHEPAAWAPVRPSRSRVSIS